MGRTFWRRRGLALVSLLAALGMVLAGAPSFAGPAPQDRKAQTRHGLHEFGQGNIGASEAPGEREPGEAQELIEARDWYSAPRLAPGVEVPAAAVSEADAAAAGLSTVGGHWSEVTHVPYDSDAQGYRDPVWSNSGGGAGLVGGRMTAMANDGRWIYGGAADGGVWVSSDHGQHWTPTLQSKETLSIGALYVRKSDHSLWVGTGEANTSSDSYAGQGVWRSTNHGQSYLKVGGDELRNALVFRITASSSFVYAATSRGLWRRHSQAARTSPWELVLKPDPNPGNTPYNTSFITDVALKPGSGGKQVIAVLGWRAGTDYNGFYVSGNAGAPGSFQKIAPAGLDASDIGRTALSFSQDGKVLYAAIQSPRYFNEGPPAPAQSTILKGVYKSASGDVAGPWTLVADSAKLAAGDSALQFPSTYEPGVQGWYNLYVQVDPTDAKHVYLGLEEIFETSDGGATWKAIGPYWNFTLPCAANGLDSCPKTTHPDQHGITIADDGTAYFGNDGGVYSRPSSLRGVVRWTDNNTRLFTLQYYFAGSGRSPRGGVDVWGGLQDNGTSLLLGGSHQQVSPFGGDGGDVLIDPNNSDNAMVEYVDLAVAISRNGGRSSGAPGSESWRLVSPACEWNPDLTGCDPSPRFIAPFSADVKNGSHWVTGGRYVWETTKGFDTVCEGNTCDWKQLTDLGAGASLTAVVANGSTVYAGSCAPCNPLDAEGGGFSSSISTNYGGTWHKVTAPNLPNRFVSGLAVDPADAAHVYAVYNGYSRRWIPSAGVGHVFESKDGGASWSDISGNLPDVPGDDLVIAKGHLVLATDNSVYVADAKNPSAWSRLGSDLPSASVNDLSLYPDGQTVLAATHGRGLWKLRLP
jgi:hypothetical protein